MIDSLKAEVRKLLTVRSTYFILLFTLAIVVLVAGYGNGYRAITANLNDPGLLAGEATDAILVVGILLAVVGLLLVGHEYRYNTILYTLTSSNSRVKTLLSKFAVISVFIFVVTTVLTFIIPLCTIAGVHIAGKHLVPQTFPVWSVLWKTLFLGWGYSMYALILAAVIRSQVGSIVSFLLIPLVGERIIADIFSKSANYLPFQSLQSVVNSAAAAVRGTSQAPSRTHDIVVVLIYIVVGAIVSFVFFVRRDAN
jgi:ABC-type transport system involved in multi-copper enzyme maturation permease subunit